MTYDVAIIGGGPAGSTCASLLRKYNPEIRVLILERDRFPRDRGVESALPPLNRQLLELDAWDKVEAAGFPVNSGATFRWGSYRDLWKLDLLLGEDFADTPRPAKLEGQRTKTTFHIERATYDKILLDHAAELGAEVREGTAVVEVLRDGDRVEGLKLANGSVVTATWYVDASGEGAIRSALDVPVEEPSVMKTVAIWDAWENEAWAETICKNGSRARFLSVASGWLWFIPLSTTRASVGFVTHADYPADSGSSFADLYAKARQEDPFLAEALTGAKAAGVTQTSATTPAIAKRLVGDNWFLVGGAAGRVDPILMAGLVLAQGGARELAYVLLALKEEEHDPAWLKTSYEQQTQRRLSQQIHFADFWYAANTHLTALTPYTGGIASAAGFEVDAKEAFQWLSHEGFAIEQLTNPSYGFFDLGPVKAMLSMLTAQAVEWKLNEVNELKMNLGGAKDVQVPIYRNGKIQPVRGYVRGSTVLPFDGFFSLVLSAVHQERDAKGVMQIVRSQLGLPADFNGFHPQLVVCLEAIEALLAEGWIKGTVNKKRPYVKVMLFQDSVGLEGAPPRESDDTA